VFEAAVSRVEGDRGLVTLAFDGGTLLTPARRLAAGTAVRVRIPAREVILATSAPAGLSLHNVLSGVVSAIHNDRALDAVIVQVTVGQTPLLAEVTRDAIGKLNIAVGRPLHALVKSVSIEVIAPEPNVSAGAHLV
jgi:molybdate transport system ATP-binding protein